MRKEVANYGKNVSYYGSTLQCVVVLFVLCYVYAIVDTNDVIQVTIVGHKDKKANIMQHIQGLCSVLLVPPTNAAKLKTCTFF